MSRKGLVDGEALDALLKEKQKQAEKAIIQASIASAALSKMQRKVNKIEQSTKDTMNVTKESVNNVTADMSSSLKGSWGNKAKESFKNNSQKLDGV
ncbi:hypothetical protein A5821_001318 [Enterococcus sp. 7F3_DIV0205]|uniref:Uncharacterized protein n=1 Tax=Candidatus Enterococcus palustris TaxID=1834189 RepID=A0AAQ3W7K2_9ENTE|nr:hypothetical protein [Enterococcus sp. 7F3_DIV0205]OTN85716.1 hypothetical protein A5821_001662 [Enterococcus sp. 7F3_DIV0205]